MKRNNIKIVKLRIVIVLYVPTNYRIYSFVEQISATKDRQSSLKLSTNIDIAGRQGATKRFQLGKANTNCKMFYGGKNKSRIICTLCLHVRVINFGGNNCILRTKQSEEE